MSDATVFDDEVTQATDGTWTVYIGMGDKPITGIPTRELAFHIAEQLWAVYKEGGRDGAYCD